eukprot:CAMPEP_0172616860 /NCGR_PEP_ID=MMETSP1068-20121228/68288_1 /TAXON_ID=35684 /ORGANISM="Pseudopedinella elastica, Strain CCMP716" /LENGTH=342 /DNA_ID=CAMNT_0013422453 /DNA_START=58 /DNA_END=1086 /DNA_ORIENTATION=-
MARFIFGCSLLARVPSANGFKGGWLKAGGSASSLSQSAPLRARTSSVTMVAASLLHVAVPSTDPQVSAAIYGAAAGMTVQRTDAAGNLFVGFGAEGECFTLKLTAGALSDANLDDALLGVTVNVADAAAAVDAAKAAGAEVVQEAKNMTLIASIVPDEDPTKPGPWSMRATVRDPHSGLDLELVSPGSEGESSGAARLSAVSFRVGDLNAATDFATGPLGMTLHRKRSWVPNKAALSTFLNYAGSESEATLVELRYVYGKAYGRGKFRPGSEALLVLSTPDVGAAVEGLSGGADHAGVVVHAERGAVDGIGGDAAVLESKDALPRLRLGFVDELDFTMQTIA